MPISQGFSLAKLKKSVFCTDTKDIKFMLPMDAKKWYYKYGFFGIPLTAPISPIGAHFGVLPLWRRFSVGSDIMMDDRLR
jgi:hypothetical protein